MLRRVNDYADRLVAKLLPESITQTLIRAGCFLSAYELIKSEVVDSTHEFVAFDFGDGKCDEARYQQDVLSRDPSRYRASCAWLVDMGGLTTAQATALEDIHVHRHEIAHELPKLLVDPDFEIKTDLLLAAVDCLRSLGVFWVRMTADIDQNVADEDIKSGSYALMEHVLMIAGFDPEAI
jgi:hypothetical protein